ncbi:MAG: hypothetical protein JKY42_09935 [Flavobacteriales bacterium]|nr:hypothetical protein [Flavobacteriales bacterium]
MKQPFQFIIFFSFLVLFVPGMAQDTLCFMNYDTLLVKVISIKSNEIQYKKFNNLNGPSYFVNTEKISRIVYPNGDFDEFNYLISGVNHMDENVMITLVNGEVIEAVLDQVDSKKIAYKKNGNPEGPTYYSSTEKIHKIVYSNGEEQFFAALKISKAQLLHSKGQSNIIKVDWNNYYIDEYRVSAKKIEERLEEFNDSEVTKLLNEAKQAKKRANALGYSSLGIAIIGTGTAFVGLIITTANYGNEILVFSGWSGLATIVALIGSGSLRPVYKDRMKRAIALYNKKNMQ